MANSTAIAEPTQSAKDSRSLEAEFEILSRELTEKELELATLESKLANFERRYARTVGVLYAELDRLEKEIAQELYRLHPDDKYKAGFERAKKKAQTSQDAIHDSLQSDEKKAFAPSDELKNLFRKVAKAIHPDLATNERERAYRTSLMARANEAYKNEDMDALERILHEWEHRDEKSFVEESQLTEPDRLEQKILRIKARLNEIETRIRELKQSDLYLLMIKVEQAELAGRDLLGDMAKDLQYQIQSARGLLDSLKQQD
jgi:hypothetical protein